MLLSMTGFGRAHHEELDFACSVEVRSVNNRFFKLSTKAPDSLAAILDRIEKHVKASVRRGSVSVTIRYHSTTQIPAARINTALAREMYKQLVEELGAEPSVLGSLIELPGIVEEVIPESDPDQDWQRLSPLLAQAVSEMDQMRREEGQAMYEELRSTCEQVSQLVEEIGGLAPRVVSEYRDRLHDKLTALLAQYGVTLSTTDLIKEVAVFADRCDISEELTRLRSHVSQFHQIAVSQQVAGRKLDFLTQEMNREANTIGSKANHAQIAQLVVDLKSYVERIREIVQNVE